MNILWSFAFRRRNTSQIDVKENKNDLIYCTFEYIYTTLLRYYIQDVKRLLTGVTKMFLEGITYPAFN